MLQGAPLYKGLSTFMRTKVHFSSLEFAETARFSPFLKYWLQKVGSAHFLVRYFEINKWVDLLAICGSHIHSDF